MATPIYQLKITLNWIQPAIWRRVLVYADTNMIDLHRIFQTVMGWTNSHVHLFDDGTHEYTASVFPMEGMYASDSYKLNDFLKQKGGKLIYLYDMGDYWEHEVYLEDILDQSKYKQIPICLGGERNCPPEDCGSVSGYEEMLEILKDPNHEEYEEMLTWLGGAYDPEYFRRGEVNKWLKRKDYGCIWLD